jgi:hypothetical protein
MLHADDSAGSSGGHRNGVGRVAIAEVLVT